MPKKFLAMGLMLSYKKFPDKYFDGETNKEFQAKNIKRHKNWFKEEYDAKGRKIYREIHDGRWDRWTYFDDFVLYENYRKKQIKIKHDQDGNEIYWEADDGIWEKSEYENGYKTYNETSNGFWEKWEYDKHGREIYYENSRGTLLNNRKTFEKAPPKSKYKPRYFDLTTGKRFNAKNIDKHRYWAKQFYDNNKKLVERRKFNGLWEIWERDDYGRETYYRSSRGKWRMWEYNEHGQTIYYANNEGLIIDNINVSEIKPFQQYFDANTQSKFNPEELSEHQFWFKETYDNHGNIISYLTYDGHWHKWEYDENHNKILYLRNDGYWLKWIHNDRGDLINCIDINNKKQLLLIE